MGLRFANGIFEPLWDRNHIERVEIVWDETLALEGRAGYFDHAGAFKDLIQNHLLQLLCLTAMEAPALHRRNLRDRKVDLLRAIRRFSPEEAQRHTVRAATVPEGSRIGTSPPRRRGRSRSGPGNRDLRLGHAHDRQLPLGGSCRSCCAGARPWAVSGARSPSTSSRYPTSRSGARSTPGPTYSVSAEAGPVGVLNTGVNGPYDPFDLEQIEFERRFRSPGFFSAYERLFLDCSRAHNTLFVRADEPKKPWRVVEPVLDAWREGLVRFSNTPPF